MTDFSPSINPYAPPTSVMEVAQRHSFYLWRDGGWLVIRIGAELPPYCMVTGGPAPYSHPIFQIWQPKWIYLLLLLAVVPYFLTSPFVNRRVELDVPFGKTVYLRHRRWVNFGIVLMVSGGVLIIAFSAFAFVASMVGQWLSGPVAVLLVAGVLLCLIGMQFASSQPMRLDIIKVEDDLIYIDNVHPAYLDRLPDAFATASVALPDT